MSTQEFPPARYWIRKVVPRALLMVTPGLVIFVTIIAAATLPYPWNAVVALCAVLLVAGVAIAVLEIDHYRTMRRLGAFDRDGNRIDRRAA